MQQETTHAEAVEQASTLPLTQISIQDGFNPRHHRTEDGMVELAESIRDQGVIQPILVRPDGDGGYYVVAGERRYRASQRAERATIPAIVRDMSNDDALAAAAAENAHREDLSVAEEARLVYRAVTASSGDRDEAARLLGWKRSRVDARMLLMHADDAVLDALEQRQISVGHAQLLASVPKMTQRGTLDKIIEDDVTVAELKGKLGSFTRELAHARFDTTECQGCPFNSSTQASLFEFTVGEGRCSNHKCWSEKTQAHIEAVKAQQAETYPAVFTDAERNEGSRTLLFAEGDNGVGAEQYAACQNCQFYGALVTTEPGREGVVTEGVCFNLECHKQMVEACKKAQQNTDGETPTDGGSQTTARPKTGTTTSTSKGQGAKTGSGKGSNKGKTAAATPKAVTAKADEFVRRQAVREFKQDTAIDDALAVYALFQLADTTSEHVSKMLTGLDVQQYSVHTPDLFKALLNATQEQRDATRRVLTMHLLGQQTDSNAATGGSQWQKMAQTVCAYRQSDLSATFRVTPDFLKAHTKSGMSALLEDAGFAAWYDEQQGQGAFAKLMKKKVGIIVAAVFPEDEHADRFDFTGYVPAEVYKRADVQPIGTQQPSSEATSHD